MTGDISSEPVPIQTKTPRVPKRVVQAIELRISGRVKLWKDAAAQVGMTPEWLSKSLKKPQVRAFYERRCRESIAELGPEAVATLADLMRNGKSEHVRLQAVEQVAKLAGWYPEKNSPLVNVNVVAGEVVGYRIDLTPRHPTIEGLALPTGKVPG